jgi:hypothetical protein
MSHAANMASELMASVLAVHFIAFVPFQHSHALQSQPSAFAS